ncbi:hypothetical protein M0Q97_13145, partial [Candidatus Dojkabacteria bacterium]|nr:hypothetical protein [Candidatus Dojkabacteria bacterium]
MANIAFYGSHNASIVVEQHGRIITVIEIERFLNLKNSGYSQYAVCKTRQHLLTEILNWIKRTYNITEFENCITMNSGGWE